MTHAHYVCQPSLVTIVGMGSHADERKAKCKVKTIFTCHGIAQCVPSNFTQACVESRVVHRAIPEPIPKGEPSSIRSSDRVKQKARGLFSHRRAPSQAGDYFLFDWTYWRLWQPCGEPYKLGLVFVLEPSLAEAKKGEPQVFRVGPTKSAKNHRFSGVGPRKSAKNLPEKRQPFGRRAAGCRSGFWRALCCWALGLGRAWPKRRRREPHVARLVQMIHFLVVPSHTPSFLAF